MEPFRIHNDLETTYDEFSRALKKLGFQNESTPEEFRYVHAETGCIIKLRQKQPDTTLIKAYFANFSFAIYYNGLIENVHDLAKMIEKERYLTKGILPTYFTDQTLL